MLVVAHFHEDLSWLPLKSDIMIINKSSEIHTPQALVTRHVQLPNIGREGHSYLWFIINYYDRLPCRVVFTQGGITDHVRDPREWVDRVENLLIHGPSEYIGLNETRGEKGWGTLTDLQDPVHPGLPTAALWQRLFPDLPVPAESVVNYCGMFYVSRDVILRHPRTFYILLNELLLSDPQVGYSLERLWGLIFTRSPGPQV